MNKYNLIAGWNRSGTSCLMAALRECGIPVLGFKYPFVFTFDFIDTKTKKQIKKGVKKDTGIIDPLPGVKNTNPSGFWEIPSICLGNGIRKEHADFGNDGNLVKVVLNVLPSSDPDMVNKVIVILRNPFKVMASRLKITPPKDRKNWIRCASLGLMYNFFVSQRWLDNHDIPYKLVLYEDLLEDPYGTLRSICFFLGRGVPEYGSKIVSRGLDRSKPLRTMCKEAKRLRKWWNSGDFDYNKVDLVVLKAEIDTIMELLKDIK